VRDYDEAKNWYTEKLGFVTLIDQKFGPSQRFLLIAPPGSGKEDVGFVFEKARRDDPTMPTDYSDRIGKEVNIVLRTSDLSRLCSDYRNRGVKFRQAPKPQPWGGEAIIEVSTEIQLCWLDRSQRPPNSARDQTETKKDDEEYLQPRIRPYRAETI